MCCAEVDASVMWPLDIRPRSVPLPYLAMDRTVHRLTRGKVLISGQVLPGVILTVRGAKSGQPRTTPLACMPEYGSEGDTVTSWILIGGNFGRPGHLAWTANLLAHPDDAVINWKGHDIAVRARLLEGAERAEVWQAALTFWPPYDTYQARVEREIRLFRLERCGTS